MAPTIDLLNEATQKLMIVVGIAMFVFGFVGNCLSVLTFSSVMKIRLFPPTVSRIYLLIAAIADLVFVAYLLSTRVLMTGFISFAAMDQFCLTSRSARIRRLSQYSRAKKISFSFILLWCLVNTPVLFLYGVYPTAVNSSSTICTVYSNEWAFYYTYIQSLILFCLLPLSLIIIFGFLTRRNILSMHQVHGSISRQLTRMILLQLLVMVLSLGVTTVQIVYQTITLNIEKTALRSAQDGMFNAVANLINYVSYCSGFYIYLYSSKSLRQNLKNLLCNNEQNQSVPVTILRSQKQQMINNRNNQVQPVETIDA